MYNYVFIGLNASRDRCCVLYSNLSLQQLEKENSIKKELFETKSTNWGGCDEISRTLQIMHLRFFGKEFILPEPIEFSGVDCDHSGKYEWKFRIRSIIEAEQYNPEEIVFSVCDSCANDIITGERACRVKYQNKTLYFCENCYHTFTANATVKNIIKRVVQP